jgi:hypothetical protein
VSTVNRSTDMQILQKILTFPLLLTPGERAKQRDKMAEKATDATTET